MNTARIITVICWIVVAVIMIGLVVWLLSGSLFGFRTGLNINKPIFHIGSIEDLTGPFDEVGTYTIEADGIDSINVDWVSGEIRITPYDGSDIIITEYARRELNNNEKLAYDVSGGTLNIQYVDTVLTFNMLTKKLDVLVPEAIADELSQLYVDITSADLTVSGFTVKTLDIDQISGTSDISNIQADSAHVDSVSGEININGLITSKLTMGTISGEVTLTDVTADTVKCNTKSGEQQLGGTFKSLDLDSISGEINIVSAADPDDIRCNTISGSVRLTIPGKADLVVSHSSVSGQFSSEVPVISSGGSAVYKFGTVSGDIRIMKSA